MRDENAKDTNSAYRELTTRKEEFQNILHILVEFDERTQRSLKYPDKTSHYIRRSISLAQPENVRILLKHLGEFVYSVIAQSQTEAGLAVSAYVHEDGIRKERDVQTPEHPVHKIVCVTELYEASESLESFDGLSSLTMELLAKDGVEVPSGYIQK